MSVAVEAEFVRRGMRHTLRNPDARMVESPQTG